MREGASRSDGVLPEIDPEAQKGDEAEAAVNEVGRHGTGINPGGMAGGRGLEPQFTSPEPVVLPLDDPPTSAGRTSRVMTCHFLIGNILQRTV